MPSYAFDLLELDGTDLRREPLEVRKTTLASILRIRLNEHLAHDCGLTVFQHACQLDCEGIVSKRLGSRYRSGRTPDWLKFKNPAALFSGSVTYRFEKKLSTSLPNAMWSMKRCQ
jgi:ATP-dependent DNA ligase